MTNQIIVHRLALEAALLTVNYRIKNLKKFYSREQVRCWFIQKKKIINELKYLPTVAQVKETAKKNTAFRKSINL